MQNGSGTKSRTGQMLVEQRSFTTNASLIPEKPSMHSCREKKMNNPAMRRLRSAVLEGARSGFALLLRKASSISQMGQRYRRIPRLCRPMYVVVAPRATIQV